MAKTFKNSPKLGIASARPFTKRIMMPSREAAVDLLAATFGSKVIRFFDARILHLRKLKKAIEAVVKLAEDECNAFPEIQGKGSFDLLVLRPLGDLEFR